MKNNLQNGDIVDVTYITYTTNRPKQRILTNLIFIETIHYEATEGIMAHNMHHFLQNNKNLWLSDSDILVIKKALKYYLLDQQRKRKEKLKCL